MLDDRKAAILRAVVEEYIETAVPVGSSHVLRASALPVSSATVRNEMVALEQEGYLRQPHTSAGRVPTDKGYRWFVDHLSTPTALERSQAQQVRHFFAAAHGELEQMLHDTSRLLSSLTDYAAVVVGPPHEAATVRSVQLVALSGRVVLAVAVLSNGVVEKRTLELDVEVGDDRVNAATAHLMGKLTGATLGALPTVAPTGDGDVDRLCAAATEALAESARRDGEQVFVGGASRMATAFMYISAQDTARPRRSTGMHLAALAGAARERARPTGFVESPHPTSLVTTRTSRKLLGVARSPFLRREPSPTRREQDPAGNRTGLRCGRPLRGW